MNKAEKTHLDRVSALGCIVCRNNGDMDTPAQIHHINHYAMGKRSSHFLVLPLCGHHHTEGGHGEAVHGGKDTWEMRNGAEMELLSQTYELLYEENESYWQKVCKQRAEDAKYFHEKARDRAMRMEMMKEYMSKYYAGEYAFSCWSNFVRSYDEVANWFDDKGHAK